MQTRNCIEIYPCQCQNPALSDNESSRCPKEKSHAVFLYEHLYPKPVMSPCYGKSAWNLEPFRVSSEFWVLGLRASSRREKQFSLHADSTPPISSIISHAALFVLLHQSNWGRTDEYMNRKLARSRVFFKDNASQGLWCWRVAQLQKVPKREEPKRWWYGIGHLTVFLCVLLF